MKALFASADHGLIGLIFFFAFFIGVLIWVFMPGAKEKFKQYGDIPLEDD